MGIPLRLLTTVDQNPRLIQQLTTVDQNPRLIRCIVIASFVLSLKGGKIED